MDDPTAYQAGGTLYLPLQSRFDTLLNLPEAEYVGGKVNEAMRAMHPFPLHDIGCIFAIRE